MYKYKWYWSEVISDVFPTCQESLVREVELDPMEGDQTWPTDEDLAEAATAMPPPRPTVARRVLRGTSDYQAAWIVEDSDSDDGVGYWAPSGQRLLVLVNPQPFCTHELLLYTKLNTQWCW